MKIEHCKSWPGWAPSPDRFKGRFHVNYPLGSRSWFGAGGLVELYAQPSDEQDLIDFLVALPASVDCTVLGGMSNVIIRAGGVQGAVIRLGAGFAGIKADGRFLDVGAAALDRSVAAAAARSGLSGCEFYEGIPGQIGGALVMNAGAHDGMTSDLVHSVRAVDRSGKIHRLTVDDFDYSYRHSAFLDGSLIVLDARLRLYESSPDKVRKRMNELKARRRETQPIGKRTGGSTFKNPPGLAAWRLIDAAGLRGFKIGDAAISDQHCNFMINCGDASAEDLEQLGEHVRLSVHRHSGTWLEWEIRRIGDAASVAMKG
ncbi:MAG: UDP-N-acetylmuramate dehydrogenase [Pseudomonadota bacterium]